MEETKKCKKNIRLPWKTKDFLTITSFLPWKTTIKARNNSCLPWKTLKKETKNIHLALSKQKCEILVVFDPIKNTTGACLAAGGVKLPKSPAEDLSNAKKDENIRPPP